MNKAQPQIGGQGIWPDGSSGERRLLECLECGALTSHSFLFPTPCEHDEPHGPTQQVRVLPASLCEELAEALETLIEPKAYDREQQDARKALARYREAVAEGGKR